MASRSDSTTASSIGKDEEATIVSIHSSENEKSREGDESQPFKHTWSLWCIFSVLCLFSFLAALDGTIITTSLPTITGAIGGGNDGLYVWIAIRSDRQHFRTSQPIPLRYCSIRTWQWYFWWRNKSCNVDRWSHGTRHWCSWTVRLV
jgi:hypothetical protein